MGRPWVGLFVAAGALAQVLNPRLTIRLPSRTTFAMNGEATIIWSRWPLLPLAPAGRVERILEIEQSSTPANPLSPVLDACVPQQGQSPVCSEPFEPTRAQQKFCSRPCRDRHHNLKHKAKGNGARVAEAGETVIKLGQSTARSHRAAAACG